MLFNLFLHRMHWFVLVSAAPVYLCWAIMLRNKPWAKVFLMQQIKYTFILLQVLDFFFLFFKHLPQYKGK